MKLVLLTTLLALLFTSAAWAASCQSVASFAPSCAGGTLVQDTTFGNCRTIRCASGTSSMQALACDKPDGGDAQYFELYKQAQSGSAVSKVCLGATCVGANGYAKSALYSCSAPAPTSTCTATTEVCDGKDNDCDGQTDESSVCATSTPSGWTIGSLAKSCVTSGTCVSQTDTVSGTCRTVTWATTQGTISVKGCDKGNGYVELYKQQAPSGLAFTACLANGCVTKDSGFVRFQPSGAPAPTPTSTCTATTEVCDGKDNDCDGQTDENNICATPTTSTSSFPLKTNIVSTIFWAGQGPSADTGWSQNYDSAWDVWWMEHYGGYDDPNNRNGYYPAGFTPKENPFYVAIPYTDFGDAGRKSNAFSVVPWSNEKATWGYQESMIKNRWVKIVKGAKAAYAQIENAGPGPTDDWQYVFGSNAQPTTDFGWKAGIDVSPAVRDYLGLGAVDMVSWQWVKASDVPSGPWKNIVTTRQSCWASVPCP